MNECPRCHAARNRKGNSFTAQGLQEHIRQCPYNPDYESFDERLEREYQEALLSYDGSKIEINLTDSVSIYV